MQHRVAVSVRAVVGVLVSACAVVVGAVAPAYADPQSWAGVAVLSMPVVALVGAGPDSDGDTVPDAVEYVVCGTATCATGREDRDGDGIADWVEVASCGGVSCGSSVMDWNRDGVPDFVERILCGAQVCGAGVTDADTDSDGVPDWVEVVICGTRTCATGGEDLDGNGVADAVELQAYAVYVRALAAAGTPWVNLLFLIALVLILAGASVVVVRQVRSRRREAGQLELSGSAAAVREGWHS